MKYTYHFANGESCEIEISVEEYRELVEADRKEYNNDHANTRRHISLDMVQETQGMQFIDPSSMPQTELEKYIHNAIELLPEYQQRVLCAVYFDGFSINEFAEKEGVCGSAISHRLGRAKKNLRKILLDRQI